MSTTPDSRLSEQEALAVTQALMQAREDDAYLMITGSTNPRALALVACGLAAAALTHGGIDGARWLAERQLAIAAEN